MATKEQESSSVKEVTVFGNNRWCAFFKFSGDEGAEQIGFFRIHRLFAEVGADVKTKKLEQASDLKDFLAANEDKKFWAKVVDYDFAGIDDSDSRYFKTEDGTEVAPRWRAEIVWFGPENEPRSKVRLFHVDHPDTKVVKVEVVPNSYLFKMEVDGEKEVGRMAPDKVVVDGKRVEKYKIRNAAALFKTLTEPEGGSKPVWALVIPNYRIKKEADNSSAVEVEGEKLIPRWYSNTVWVSDDSTPPSDALNKKPPRGFFKKKAGGDFGHKKKWQNKNKSHGDHKGTENHGASGKNQQDEPKSLAEVLARRAMSCLNPNDPKIATVVTNAKEMETALLIAKVLETSAMLFNAGNSIKPPSASSESAPRNPPEQAGSGPQDPETSYEFGIGGYSQRSGDNPLKNGALQGQSRSPRGRGVGAQLYLHNSDYF